ncbi:hypothetical protein DSO57_1021882 [Entomophthora muscae]|uniref:Uncharacterized protein n=1 Tax=Entomophthora muscae TaxID=34485 RepID=A0ACC2SG84_9FUNG|nr:hypothetical protein DSO57_1021882 [Entomophthora muscae]
MTLPLTPQPNRPQESMVANESVLKQLFGVIYITLTGLVDSMVPSNGPWAILDKSLSYIVKLAPIIWQAIPSGPADHLPANSQEPPAGWIPDNSIKIVPFKKNPVLYSGLSFSFSKLATWEGQVP